MQNSPLPNTLSNKRESILTLIVLFITLLAGLFYYFIRFFEPVHPYPPYTREVLIERGSSTSRIASLLEEEGLIHSALFFKLLVRMTGQEPNLQAGIYRLQSDMPLFEIVRRITRGLVVTESITIPEGFTIKEIGDLFQVRMDSTKEEFYQSLDRVVARYPSISKEYTGLPHHHELEGYLFPDTYQYSHGKSLEDLISLMVERFYRMVNQYSMEEMARELGLSLHQLVTMASIIEKEAQREDERALIAGVIYNRLRIGMPLQVDATVLYVLPERKEVVLYRDLEVESPYNTYSINGLPPGPISNPGLPSLLAALYPASTDYYYYVARRDGSHIFSKTYQQHLQAIREAAD